MNLKSYFKILFIFVCVFCIINIYAYNPKYTYSEKHTYVICADKEKNWYWLPDTWLEGTWVTKHLANQFIIRYFILNGESKQYKLLQEACQNNFGKQFIYPQPSLNALSSWSVFCDKYGNKYPGHESYSYNFNKMPRY